MTNEKKLRLSRLSRLGKDFPSSKVHGTSLFPAMSKRSRNQSLLFVSPQVSSQRVQCCEDLLGFGQRFIIGYKLMNLISQFNLASAGLLFCSTPLLLISLLSPLDPNCLPRHSCWMRVHSSRFYQIQVLRASQLLIWQVLDSGASD